MSEAQSLALLTCSAAESSNDSIILDMSPGVQESISIQDESFPLDPYPSSSFIHLSMDDVEEFKISKDCKL